MVAWLLLGVTIQNWFEICFEQIFLDLKNPFFEFQEVFLAHSKLV